ncbi:MAG: glycosyltransferase family 4 protein [Chloroflexi bacterium]|nr:glycosyltransferase family 4 protein [Chloroflexota bacterium]
MKIYILSAVFPPEPIVSAQTSYSLALGLVERYHNVRVITNFPNRPQGMLYKSYKRSFYLTKNDPAGFLLVRCFTFFSKESSMISRWMENISFGVSSSLYLLFSQKPDAVYSNTWPIFATWLTSLVCKIRHIPLVISVQDINPESLVIQGRLKPNHWVYRLFLAIDQWIAKKASKLIVLSENIVQYYEQTRRVDPARIHIIPNWVDQNCITQINKNEFRKEAGISSGAFVIVYGGNVGKAAGVETIIQAIGKITSEREIVLVIAGSGSELPSCQKLAASVNSAHILFHTPWKPEETSKVLSAADVLILPTQGTQSLVSVPSKLLSYLLASRPVLAMVLLESDTAQVIKNAECGWIVPPDNVNFLTEKIKEVASIPLSLLEEKGRSGREYALNTFTTKTLLPKVIQIIEDVTCRT